MTGPVPRPIPRFIADASREPLPYGRWEERLREQFRAACEPYADEAKAPPPEKVGWFPERGWGGRVYVPATARSVREDGSEVEYFGFVSFRRPGEGEPTDLAAKADFTDVLAEDNPGWKIDLSEEVIGAWHGEASREGQVTLVWGTPLVEQGNPVAATADLDRDVVDQTPIVDGRFTIVALDALKGFGDDAYMTIRIWDRKAFELAAESLYDEP